MKSAVYFVFLFVISISNASPSQHNPFYCFAEDLIRPQRRLFNRFTHYDVNRGQNIDPTISNCTPSKFWLYSRHGTRMPSVNQIANMVRYGENIQQEIIRNYDAGRTSLCAGDIELLRNWTFDHNVTDHAMYLVLSGWNEMEGLGRRYQAAFPTLLPSNYSKSHYFFQSSDEQRTIASLNALADGLFGYNGFEEVEFEDFNVPDLLLRPYFFCPLSEDLWYRTAERDAFADGPEYQEMLSQVSAKLGFIGSNALRRTEVETLYLICVFEQVWYPDTPSPMCAGFSIANHQVREYHDDLDFYYRNGYGFPQYRRFHENLSCYIMQDWLQFIQSTDPNDPTAKLYNAHIDLFVPMLVSLGVFEDSTPLTRHNFAQQTFRLWKISQILPSGANIVVVRYE